MPSLDTDSIAREVRQALPRAVFEPATRLLWWVPVHLAVIGAASFAIWSADKSDWSVALLLPLSLLIGLSFAGLAFVGHETLHGATTKKRWLRRLVGHVGFFPFWVSPRLWIVWHNRVHHGHTNVPGRDPDMYPTKEENDENWLARWAVIAAAPRQGKLRGIVTLLVGFSLQSLQVLFRAKKHKYLSTKHYVSALLESGLAFSVFVSWGLFAGFKVWLLSALVPLFIGNAIVMAHIVTNHSLSRLSTKNDPLATSLSVSTPRWFSLYTLGFGYHVEHHLFPSVSQRHGALIQQHLRRRAPERYQCMPLTRALRLLFSTPRIYENETTLFDPETGQRFAALGVGPNSAAVVSLFSPQAEAQAEKQSVPPPSSAA